MRADMESTPANRKAEVQGPQICGRSPAVRSRLPSTRGPGMPGHYTSAIFQK